MVEEIIEKSEIAAISNKNKNTLDNLIDSLDTKSLEYLDFLNQSRLIDKRSRNMPKSGGNILTFLKQDFFDVDVSITLLELAQKIQKSQVINTMTLQYMVPKVGELNIRRINGVERTERVKKIDKIEKVREVKRTIEEIK